MSATSVITLDVGGRLFKTTKTTLCKANYFESLFDRWNPADSKEPIFIDRNPDGFEHVLNFLRDSNHKVPNQYEYELDYFGIKYNDENLQIDSIDKLNQTIEKLYKSFTTDGEISLKIENEHSMIKYSIEKLY